MGRKKKNDKTLHDIKITPYHVNNEVTGSSVLIEVDNLKILFDLGMYQSQSRNFETVNRINSEKLNIPYDELDYIILSSSHCDHCAAFGITGRTDVDFKGVGICTELSQELIALNLLDGAFLMETQCKAYNKIHNSSIKPLYTRDDAYRSLSNLKGYGYDEKIYLSNKVYIEFLPNGHLSGDGSIYLTYEKDENNKKRILYTGDHNYGKEKSKPFTMEWQNKNIKPDLVITESTYGGEIQPKGNPIDELEKYIMEEVIEKKNTLFIPSFSIHRSTELAYMMKIIYDRNPMIRDVNIPMYFAGVMMAKAHRIIGNPKYKCFYDDKWQNEDELFSWNKIRFIESFKDVQSKLVNPNPKIIVSSSGMLTGGYSVYLLSCYITNKKCSILFTGYQGIDTTGRKIYEHQHKTVSIQGKQYPMKANILGKLEGLSGHADGNGLANIFDTINQHNLKKVVIIHGEDTRKEKLKSDLDDKFKDRVKVLIPKAGTTIGI